MVRTGASVASRAAGTVPPAPAMVVIDTNCVLDLLVFGDERVAGLQAALQAGRVRWCATPPMRAELARVLRYPRVAPRLALAALHEDEVLAAFDDRVLPCDPAPPAPVRCRDLDDQMFIDLAVQRRATLFSKDARVLGLARSLRPLGVMLARAWPLDVEAA